MVIVDTKLSRLNKLLKKKITIKQLDQCLADMGMELDEINGDEIKIELTAERIDLITPEGLARAINCYLGYAKKYPETKINKSNYVHKVKPIVKKYRAFTRSFIVKNLKFSSEDIKAIMWIQEKIHDTYGRKRKKLAIGLYDLDLIKLPVTYDALKPESIKFIPLGMTQELNGRQILQKHPTGRDYAHLIEKDDKYPIQIDSKGQILSMPPIINSDNLGKITKETKNLFIECTGPEEGTLDNAMNILSTMFGDWDGKIYSVTIEDGRSKTICPNLTPEKRTVSSEFVNKHIGINLKPKETAKMLTKMGHEIISVKGDNITFNVPATRTDIWHDVDIADDVARGYGFNNIKLTLPNISTMGKMLPINELKEDICNFLANIGLVEVNTFALTSKEVQYEKMNISEEKHIALGKNTTDKSLNMVRSWLLPELMKVLVANRNKEYPQKIYESAIVVSPDNKEESKARNVEKLACLLCEEKTDFTKAKQVLDAIFSYLGLEYEIKEAELGTFISGRAGEVYLKGKKIGSIGEINPQVLSNWELFMPVSGFEINLDEVLKAL
jgi:phenylalanyl-tRNA synthetase beta chain